jgi:hypothetical protein
VGLVKFHSMKLLNCAVGLVSRGCDLTGTAFLRGFVSVF